MFDIISEQMVIMGILMVLGILLFKTKLITQEGSRVLTKILIYLITPTAVFKSFCIEFTPEKLKSLGLSIILGILIQVLGILISHLIFIKRPLEEFAASYANTGFFGIAVIQACLGSEAVFFIAPLVVFTGVFQHSYGVSILLGSKKEFNCKRAFFSPNMISFYAGLIVFLTGLGNKIPSAVSHCINLVANMNAFFSMTTLGIMFIQSDLKQLYKNMELYTVSFLKLLVIPVICTLLFRFIPVKNEIKLAILLAYAGPMGSNVANYSLLYNRDYAKASLYVSVSIILYLLTFPLYSILAQRILQIGLSFS